MVRFSLRNVTNSKKKACFPYSGRTFFYLSEQSSMKWNHFIVLFPRFSQCLDKKRFQYFASFSSLWYFPVCFCKNKWLFMLLSTFCMFDLVCICLLQCAFIFLVGCASHVFFLFQKSQINDCWALPCTASFGFIWCCSLQVRFKGYSLSVICWSK